MKARLLEAIHCVVNHHKVSFSSSFSDRLIPVFWLRSDDIYSNADKQIALLKKDPSNFLLKAVFLITTRVNKTQSLRVYFPLLRLSFTSSTVGLKLDRFLILVRRDRNGKMFSCVLRVFTTCEKRTETWSETFVFGMRV
ncbi:hypothetical protein L596_020519 [Steinernema carpocapsae]|uniref:Uncharacterized protein n=1 Tax=Steinernema carpocapsae TaxID=34508 RepID=A0A4U5MTS7_STECR|nr:hypothetical protein L596_020519 [Steinernema carpocapsae]